MKQDIYELLGVNKNATDDEIKSAFRKLAKQYHPDLHKGADKEEAEAKFKQINEAYEVLTDKEKRAKYDQYGHAAFDPAAGAGGYGWGSCAWCEPTLYNDLDSGEVAISSPLNEEERKLVGNGEITICGAARDVSSIRALLGGKMIASAKTGADGGFNLKINSRNLELGKNQVVLSPIGGKGHDATVEITKQNKNYRTE